MEICVVGRLTTMAYVVRRPKDSWEIRLSKQTPAGPRAKTLASFRELDDAALEHALARSDGELDIEAVRSAARRAGAPVALEPIEAGASRLIAELSAGESLREPLRRALLTTLEVSDDLSDAERAALAWLGAGPERRGDALRDLLLVADRIPRRRTKPRRRFPRLDSTAE